jgi:hypothetical protein
MLEAIPVLSGTQGTGFAFTVYTGDIVSHDPENQLSRWELQVIIWFCPADVTFRDITLYTEAGGV